MKQRRSQEPEEDGRHLFINREPHMIRLTQANTVDFMEMVDKMPRWKKNGSRIISAVSKQ